MPSDEDAEKRRRFSSALVRCTNPQPTLFQAHVALAPNDQMVEDFDIENLPISDYPI